MDWETFQKGVKPKLQGSWNLHNTLPVDMDFFIMLSSVAGVSGSRSQANYNAGNVFQDSLADHRQSLGMPAITIDLGVILSMGYVAENRERTVFAKGRTEVLAPLSEDEVLTLLDFGMDSHNNVPAQIIVGVADTTTYRKNALSPPAYLGDPLFTLLRTHVGEALGSESNSSIPTIEAQLRIATSIEEVIGIVESAICEKLSSQLAVSVQDVDLERSVTSNGVDSLVAMELRAFFLKTLKADIPLLDITGPSTLRDICHKIAVSSTAIEITT
jgi:acyl carrier protein